ncbi:hypothetical protein CYMTET_8020 [Cymbomonas tetramitiformis]|uniref:Uncharacterized protein n=1 Tax=Cymbomonas tetramitiformis TaxID=36881 RepID=A0AAE0GUD1_9CHLO|nr:hypothetical protein CYMTET_8020 [Cymbomonas tetramitiformis]
MVTTRSAPAISSRRRSLATTGYYWLLLATIGYYWLLFATIGYYWLLDAAARHAATPATPSAAAQPTSGSQASAFVAALRTLQRDHFDVKAAKCVQRKLFNDKEHIFTEAESHVGELFPILVYALGEVFVTEDAAFATLFSRDGATASVRVEANRLLYSTLELLMDPDSPAADWMDASSTASPLDGKRVQFDFARRLRHCDDPFQGTSDLRVVLVADKDPHDAISDFNAAPAAARRRSTLNESDVKALLTSRPWTKCVTNRWCHVYLFTTNATRRRPSHHATMGT